MGGQACGAQQPVPRRGLGPQGHEKPGFSHSPLHPRPTLRGAPMRPQPVPARAAMPRTRPRGPLPLPRWKPRLRPCRGQLHLPPRTLPQVTPPTLPSGSFARTREVGVGCRPAGKRRSWRAEFLSQWGTGEWRKGRGHCPISWTESPGSPCGWRGAGGGTDSGPGDRAQSRRFSDTGTVVWE